MATNAPKVSVPTKAVVSAKPAPLSKYAQNLKMAEKMSGYNSSSPIWGKQLPEVLDMIDMAFDNAPSEVKELTQELRKRIAKGRIMKAQS